MGTAIALRSSSLIQYLVNKGVDLNDICEGMVKGNNSPLYNALSLSARWGYNDIFDKLIDMKADLNKLNSNNLTVLHIASAFNNIHCVERILNLGMDVNMPIKGYSEFENATPLILAILNNNEKIVEFLMQKGANINVLYTNQQNTVLHIAASQGNIKLLELMIKKNPEVLFVNSKDNLSALHYAAGEGKESIIEFLVNQKLNINEKTSDLGLTPLHLAAQNRHLSVIKKLLILGADTTLLNNNGKRADEIGNWVINNHISSFGKKD